MLYAYNSLIIMALQQKKQRMDIKASRTEWRENPKGKSGIVFCKTCNAVYFKKAWHHNLRYHKSLTEDTAVSFAECPACLAIKNNQFEGRIAISNVPKNITEHLENLVHAFTHRAFQKDPLDRLIAIKKTGNAMEITVTENQLAAKLAKKIESVFKKAVKTISYSRSKKDKAVDIVIAFHA